MELFIIDNEFRSLYNIDVFESFIWTERYNGYGNFEFYTPVSDTMMDIIATIQEKMEAKLDCYVWLKESASAMVIEDIEISTDTETGSHLIVSGRGLESLLERRIVWEQTSVRGKIQTGVKKLLDDAIINPKLSDRKVPGFRFVESKDPYIINLTHRAQYTGDNLYDVVLKICDTYQLGFDVSMTADGHFEFCLIHGQDRSYEQDNNPYVIFSPKYENIVNSNYLESGKTLKNVTLVAGEGEGSARKKRIVGGGTGLSRRELYTDARDIQSDEYSDQLNEDREALNKWQELLEENERGLAEAISEFNSTTTDYNKTKSDYISFKSDYEARISALNQRISYYNTQITNYGNSLTAAQKNQLASRNSYKAQSDDYANLISGCSDKISDYNSKISNERAMRYTQLVQYEEAIDSQEDAKKQYEDAKKDVDSKKEEIEKVLPNYESQLKDYEDMISKYEGVVESNQKTLDDETKEYNGTTAEYNKIKSTYESNKATYEANIATCKQKIAEYEAKIVADQKEIDELMDALLDQRGAEELAENVYMKAFTGEIEARKTFVYGKDFVKGDLVQIVNEYGMESKARVSEIMRVQDTNGYSMYPTFQVLE